jgi:outer membrane protein assembly factor BamE (lipoprotein component of BamABCDE complex)
MTHWSGRLIGTLLLAALTGCAFVRANVGDPLPEDRIRAIQRGVTTKAQVLEALGPPDFVSHMLAHEVFQYRYGDGKLGVVLIFSRANFKTDDLYLFFTRDDVVADVIFGKRTDSVRFQFWPFGG